MTIININKELPGFDRYNGGWIKNIKKINKQKQNGYSLIGDFLPNNQGNIDFEEGVLYLDCSIGGSRKNQERDYHLFKIQDGELILLQTIENGGSDWAVSLWDTIETELSKTNIHFKHMEKEEAGKLIQSLDTETLARIQNYATIEANERGLLSTFKPQPNNGLTFNWTDHRYSLKENGKWW